MATETQVSITRQDPAIEAYRLGLLKDTQGYIKQEIAKGTLPPDFQIANLTPEQQQAISMASQGVGAYQPYLQAGTQTLGQGIGATGAGIDTLGNALQTTGAGQGFINQAAQQAADTRDTPYAYQAAANQGLGASHTAWHRAGFRGHTVHSARHSNWSTIGCCGVARHKFFGGQCSTSRWRGISKHFKCRKFGCS
jgi:hypothetical protein